MKMTRYAFTEVATLPTFSIPPRLQPPRQKLPYISILYHLRGSSQHIAVTLYRGSIENDTTGLVYEMLLKVVQQFHSRISLFVTHLGAVAQF